MEVQLRQLNDAVHEIIGEQLYQKVRSVLLLLQDAPHHTHSHHCIDASTTETRDGVQGHQRVHQQPCDVVVRWPDSSSHRICLLAGSTPQVRTLPSTTSTISWTGLLVL
jgi:hypothetical protein